MPRPRRILVLLVAFVTLSFYSYDAPGQLQSLASLQDVDVVRRNVVDYYVATNADRSDARLRASLEGIEAHTRELTRAGFLLSDGSWSDLRYDEIPTGAWSPWEHFRRLMVLARAYSTPGQSLHRNPALLRQIESVIHFIPTFYGVARKAEGNWWFWTIGPALDLGPALILVSDSIDPVILKEGVDVLRLRVGPWPGLTSSYSSLGGQNLVWSALNHTMLAALTNDPDRIDQARDRIAAVCSRTPGRDGIQNDLSFHQHGPQLYTAGYGSSFAYEVSRYVLVTAGTSFELPPAAAQTFGDYLADSLRWTLYGNHFDLSALGREAVKPSTSGFNGLAALLHVSGTALPRSEENSATAAAMLAGWGSTLPPELAGLAASLRGRTAAWPDGHRHFTNSDYTIHRRNGWFASIKMFSSRTRSGERTNGENLLGSRQSDGRMHLVVDGDEYYDGEALPSLDWSRLPGITVDLAANAANDLYGSSLETFAGGVSDGRNGVAAMKLTPIGSALSARKGWIFFDDSIVAFVNDAKSLSGNSVETIVDQRRVRGVDPLTVDGVRASSTISKNPRWASADGIGYWFPESASVRIREESRSGNWNALAVTNPDRVARNMIRSVVIEHGKSIVNSNAVYAIVPGVSSMEMNAWHARRPLTVLANDSAVSAARDVRTSTTGMIFWTIGAIDGVSVDRPSVVLRKMTGKRMTLAVSDPTQSTGTMRITLAGRWTLISQDRPVVVESSPASTTLIVSRDGRSTVVTLDPIVESRRRSSRRS